MAIATKTTRNRGVQGGVQKGVHFDFAQGCATVHFPFAGGVCNRLYICAYAHPAQKCTPLTGLGVRGVTALR